MHEPSSEPAPSLDWFESSSAKAWAQSDLPLEPIPGFGSSARRKLQQSIADDEAEIMRLEDSIRHLRHRVGRNRARLAPIRLIPNETLSAIFLDWLHLRDLPKTTVIGRFVSPSTIMKVCRRWAACAIFAPAIWSHGKYRIDTSDIACSDRIQIFKTLFDRAGSRNLKVDFGGSDEHCIADKVWCEVMQPLLLRMDDLTLSGIRTVWDDDLGPGYEWPEQKIVMSLTICTRLSQLNLHWIDFPESDGQVPIVLPTVRNIVYDLCNGNPPIQCPGLVYCKVLESSLSHSYSLSLSTSSPFLDKVFLHLNYQDRGQATSQPTFLCLKHLVIGGQDDWSIPGWFSDAPNLSSLDLYLCEYSFESVIEVISLSSSFALTSLSLTMASAMAMLDDEDIETMQEWMSGARSLTQLRLTFKSAAASGLDETCGMERYIEPLLTTGQDPPCFPHLEHLTIEGELQLETVLLQLMLDRASDEERVEAGFPPCEMASGIVQRPCLLTLVNSCTLPNMKSVGLNDFLEIRRREALCDAVREPDEVK